MSNNNSEAVAGCLVVLIVLVGFSLLFSLPVMWLWNWLMPMIFGLKTLTWVQAWGLTLLCNMLFKSTNSTTNSK